MAGEFWLSDRQWAAMAAMLAALIQATPGGLQLIDSTTAKAHRSPAGGKGGATARPKAARAAGGAPRSAWSSMVRAASSPSPSRPGRWVICAPPAAYSPTQWVRSPTLPICAWNGRQAPTRQQRKTSVRRGQCFDHCGSMQRWRAEPSSRYGFSETSMTDRDEDRGV